MYTQVDLQCSKMMKGYLESKPAHYRVVLFSVLGISFGISIAHFLVPDYFFVVHGFLRRLYYIPLILTGLLYGLRNTIYLLGLIVISYGPFILLRSREDPIFSSLDKVYELLIICFIGVITAILSDRSRVRRIELQHAYHETVLRLAIAAEYKDEKTGTHLLRISRYSELIANRIDLIKLGSMMHDIGKIGIQIIFFSVKGNWMTMNGK